MARSGSSSRPLERRASAPAAAPERTSPLRLSVGRGGLALELVAPVALGPLEVEELSVALVGLDFPVDLSGGVPRFRHRRGALERLVVRGSHTRLAREVAHRLRGLLADAAPALAITPVPGGFAVGASAGRAAVAFEAQWAPRDGDARFVVAHARGAGLGRPALAVALHAMNAIVGRVGARRGAIVRVPAAAAAIAREILPALGARAPDARTARWGALEMDAAGWKIACDRALAPPELANDVLRELELATMAEDADERLAAGDLDGARELYLALLERAPRHPALARRLAEIDLTVAGRDEAALATLLESGAAVDAGCLGGELLARVGDVAGARAAFERAAELEAHGPLAALAWLRAAELAPTARERVDALDRAVARAPAMPEPRWARFDARLGLSDFRGAKADAEHLEAAARGAAARHAVWRRAGDAFLAHGHDAEARGLFERALRYAPDSPAALAGLGRSLLAAGRASRGIDVLARAVERSGRGGAEDATLVVDLARALAERAHDLPAAIARVHAVPAGTPATLDARGLEARWRAQTDDVAGASVAWARLREWTEAATSLDAVAAARWLVEAARFEEEVRGDLRAAERHLAAALRLRPEDRAIAAAFRRVVEPAPRVAAKVDVAPPAPAPAPMHERAAETPREATAHERAAETPREATAEDEARIATLTDRLRADPTQHAIAVELADLLAAVGRDLDLFALLAARLEDASLDERADLAPRHRRVLARLAAEARAAGRAAEAALYDDALASL